ncbi:hypothetical protein B0H14DRAFT_890538 [Mycena olivaceomarginata]|nr:hypothetical protein B0H14DRAFT_890538 [Mycena olivaceomarginata]
MYTYSPRLMFNPLALSFSCARRYSPGSRLARRRRPSRLRHHPPFFLEKFDLFFFHAISWALVPEVHRRVFTACQVVRVSARFPFRAYTIITCTFPVCDACGDVGDIVNRGRRCLGVPRSVSRSSCPPGMCCLPVRREPSFCDFEISLLCLCSLRVNPPPTVFLIFRIEIDQRHARTCMPRVPQLDTPLRSKAPAAVVRAQGPGRGRTAQGGGGFWGRRGGRTAPERARALED